MLTKNKNLLDSPVLVDMAMQHITRNKLALNVEWHFVSHQTPPLLMSPCPNV